ncbi:MAG: thioesterase family protein [Acidimicrobiales bacterium]|nr:thioesterase family protein [Acidimicrobiales bacterium]
MGTVTFGEAIAVRSDGDGRFTVSVPPSWTAGDLAPGGLVAAQLLAVGTALVDDPALPPRSFTTQFLRAVCRGSYEVEAEVLRRGRSTANVGFRAVQDGAVVATAHGVFAGPRSGPEFAEIAMPDVAPPTPGRPTEGYVPPFARPYADNVVIQERLGPPALSGSAGPMEKAGWVGFAAAHPLDAAGLAMMADVGMMPWWGRLEEPYGTAALECTVQFRGHPPDGDPGDLVLMHSRTGLVHDGYLDWDSWMWSDDGTLLCQARQLLVVVGAVPSE